jgi:hypothetical protein
MGCVPRFSSLDGSDVGSLSVMAWENEIGTSAAANSSAQASCKEVYRPASVFICGWLSDSLYLLCDYMCILVSAS